MNSAVIIGVDYAEDSDQSVAATRTPAGWRIIHPRALKELGEEACIVALGVARDLRSGVIPPERFDQRFSTVAYAPCGTPCCIIGHIRLRLNDLHFTGAWTCDPDCSDALIKLFSGLEPSDPQLAADAIERYIYDGSETPWQPTPHG